MGIAARQRKIGQSRKTSDRLRGSVNTKKSDKRGSEFATLKPIVLKRDDYTCCRCHRQNHPNRPTDLVLTVDHKVPVSSGGKNTLSNLITICSLCHSKKLGKKNKMGAPLLRSLTRSASSGSTSSWGETWKDFS